MKALWSALLVITLLPLTGCTATTATHHRSSTVGSVSRSAPTEQDIAALFDRWNQSLQTGDPQKVVANYAERSILLPTVSNKPRLTPAEKVDYFRDCSMVAENNEPRRRARLQEKAGFLGNCQ